MIFFQVFIDLSTQKHRENFFFSSTWRETQNKTKTKTDVIEFLSLDFFSFSSPHTARCLCVSRPEMLNTSL